MIAWLHRHTSLLLALAAGAFYIPVAWFITFQKQIVFTDELARIADATYVVFSRNPHLAAIGLVWNPLPSLLEIPLVLLLRPFHLLLFAGPLLTAIFASLNVVLIKRILNQLGVHGPLTLLLVAVYALNPFVILYASNGMSESIFFTTIFLLVSAILSWRDSESPAALLLAGLACALTFTVRFEAMALMGAGAFAVLLVWLNRPGRDVARLEGEELAFLTPFFYTLGLWLFTNWLIEGSPLFFISGSSGSSLQFQNLAQSGSAVSAYQHHLLGSAIFALTRAASLMPSLLLMPILLVVAAVQRRPLLLIPLLFPAFILVMQIYLLYKGQSFGDFRYYSYGLPLGLFTAALIIGLLQQVRTRRLRLLRGAAVLAVVAATVLSLPSTLMAMEQPSMGDQEAVPVAVVMGLHGKQRDARDSEYARLQADRAIARYINSLHLRDGSVVTDTTIAFRVLLFADNPKVYVIPSDLDFHAITQNLSQFHGYALLSSQKAYTASLLAHSYEILSGRARWATLQRRVGSWYLYKIHPGPGIATRRPPGQNQPSPSHTVGQIKPGVAIQHPVV